MANKQLKPVHLLQQIISCQNTEDNCEDIVFKTKRRNRRTEHSAIPDLDEEMALFLEKEKAIPKTKVKYSTTSKEYIAQFITHPQLLAYELTGKDAMIIANLWSRKAQGRSETLSWNELIKNGLKSKDGLPEALSYLATLLDRDIVFDENNCTLNHHNDPCILFKGDYRLHTQFSYDLMGNNIADKIDSILSLAWESTKQINGDLVKSRHILMKSFDELDDDPDDPSYHYKHLRNAMQPVFGRLAKAKTDLPMIKFIREHELSDIDIFVLFWVYASNLLNESCSIILLLNMISWDYQDRLNKLTYFSCESKLPKLGLDCNGRGRYMCSSDVVSLSSELLATLSDNTLDMSLRNGDDEISVENKGTFFVKMRTEQTMDKLILPTEEKNLLDQVVRFYQNKEDNDLSKWGIGPSMTGVENSATKGTCILLYGYPGTGKTYSAGAIANSLGKELMAIEASKLRNAYYGSSQKLVRQVFQEMRNLIAESSNPPVFLLNEADQIVHARSMEDYSCSNVENAIQNIFLEELETFPGILIMTTNLVEKLDTAFERRFDLKIEMHLPDYDCRYQLWKLHLNKDIPGAGEIDIAHLAKHYKLSGGQIFLIVYNACREAISRSGIKKRLTIGDLLKYAELEQPWCKDEEPRKQIGFCA